MEQEKKFKPYDRVLIRHTEQGKWIATTFSHYSDSEYLPYVTSYGQALHCIPYEGNEHLVGTNDTPKPTRWKAKWGQVYFYINHMFEVNKVVNVDCECDKYLFDIGNHFHTKEEAEEMINKIKKLCKGE